MAKSAQKPTELNINLIKETAGSGTGGDIIKWVLSVGRYLVIAAEIIALGTFAWGIKLSADKNDLKTRVKALEMEVDSKAACDPGDLQSFCEDRFRNLQFKISQIGALRDSQFKQSQVLADLLSHLPKSVKLSTLSLTDSKVSFNGSFPSTVQLQTLVNSFNDSKFNDLDIQQLSSPTTSNPNFTFSATANISANDFTQSR